MAETGSSRRTMNEGFETRVLLINPSPALPSTTREAAVDFDGFDPVPLPAYGVLNVPIKIALLKTLTHAAKEIVPPSSFNPECLPNQLRRTLARTMWTAATRSQAQAHTPRLPPWPVCRSRWQDCARAATGDQRSPDAYPITEGRVLINRPAVCRFRANRIIESASAKAKRASQLVPQLRPTDRK